MGACPAFCCGFELPVDQSANYAAVRYDLTKSPPEPTREQIREVTWKIANLHRYYVGALLNLVAEFGTFLVNLSPLASFKDMVLTLPPNTLLTGEMKMPKELSDG
jgi:hypothetical protein